MFLEEKNIVFLISSLRGGGAEGICVTLANSFVKEGWKVTIVLLKLTNSVLHKELNEKVELIDLNKNHARSSFFKLSFFLHKIKPKQLLVFNHQLAILLVFIRILLGQDFKIISRNISTLSRQKHEERSIWHKYVVHFFIKVFYNKVNLIIAQSYGMRKDLIENFGITKNKTIVINNPVNYKIEEYLSRHHLKIKKKNFLLCVGRLENVKAFHFALNAFSKIQENFPDLRLKFVGDGKEKQNLISLAKSLNIENKVDFEGFNANLIPFYLETKVTLLTSIYEGFPNVVVESIALGTPVVAFDCQSGPNEIIIEGVNGFLVNYLDENHLKQCLTRALTRDWDSEIIRETAKKYSQKRIIQLYFDVFK